jgi:hypothetical protein
MEIGTDGVWLLSIIAHTEDAAHYRSPVKFWNDQLFSVTGLKTWDRLNRARKKAVAAGWLHYEPGGKGKVGKYWVTIPGRYEGLPDNSVAEDDPIILRTSEGDNQLSSAPVKGITNYPPHQHGQKPDTNLIEAWEKPDTSLDHSKPVPVPSPDPKKRARSIDADVDVDVDAHPFDAFWAVTHRKVGRKVAKAKFQAAVREIRADKRRDLDGQTPEEFLIERMKTFAASPNAHPTDRTPIHPATWLYQGRYDDDPATWQEEGSSHGPKTQSPTDGSFAARQSTKPGRSHF